MKLVLIEWEDHSSPNTRGWMTYPALAEYADPLICHSVGWLVKETPKVRMIVGSKYAPNEGWEPQASHGMVILKSSTRKVTVLRKT